MERNTNKRFKIGLDSEEHEKLRLLASAAGLHMSAYIRSLILREWNASPHLWSALEKKGEGSK